MAVTCANLINPAFRVAGISKLPGAGPGTDQTAEAIPALNRMMSSLSLTGGYIFTQAIDDYAWPANTESRTFGPTGDYTMAKAPLYINAADWIMQGGSPEVQYQLGIARNAAQWLQLCIPDLTTTYPAVCYPDGNQPNMKMHLYPVPTQASVLRLGTWTRLKSDFAATNDIAYLPDGYEEAIVLNFGIRLHSLYSSEYYRPNLQPETRQLAGEALRRVRILNTSSPKIISDADFLNAGNNTVDGIAARLSFLSGGLVG